jgi:hypothetical protein
VVLKDYKTSTKPPPVLQYLFVGVVHLFVSVVLKDLHLYYTYRFKFGAGFIIKRALNSRRISGTKVLQNLHLHITDSSSEWGSL